MVKVKFACLSSIFEEKNITQTNGKLYKNDGDSAPSIAMVKKCFAQFRCARTSMGDSELSRLPVEVVTSEIIEKIPDVDRSEIEIERDRGRHRHFK